MLSKKDKTNLLLYIAMDRGKGDNQQKSLSERAEIFLSGDSQEPLKKWGRVNYTYYNWEAIKILLGEIEATDERKTAVSQAKKRIKHLLENEHTSLSPEIKSHLLKLFETCTRIPEVSQADKNAGIYVMIEKAEWELYLRDKLVYSRNNETPPPPLVKVGVSNNTDRRLTQANKTFDNGESFKILRKYGESGDPKTEKKFHEILKIMGRWKDTNGNGTEWFNVTPEELDKIAELLGINKTFEEE